MKTIAEILNDVQSISRKKLTSIKQVKRTPRVQIVRASDINGDIYVGVYNNSFYYTHRDDGIIYKLD